MITNMKPPKMDPEAKQVWLTALRSGEYKQGHHVLHDKSGGFCCLGVLLDVTGETWQELEGERTMLPTSQPGYAYLNNTNLARFGLDDAYATDILAVSNDRGVPFSEIANMIEKDL